MSIYSTQWIRMCSTDKRSGQPQTCGGYPQSECRWGRPWKTVSTKNRDTSLASCGKLALVQYCYGTDDGLQRAHGWIQFTMTMPWQSYSNLFQSYGNEMMVFRPFLCTLFRLNWAKQTPGIMESKLMTKLAPEWVEPTTQWSEAQHATAGLRRPPFKAMEASRKHHNENKPRFLPEIWNISTFPWLLNPLHPKGLQPTVM